MRQKSKEINPKVSGIKERILGFFTQRRKQYLETPLLPTAEQKKAREKLARAFLIIALICGVLISIILPPMCAPDEHVHFVHAYDMSRGNLFVQAYEGNIVRFLPEAMYNYIQRYPVSMNGIQNGNRYNHYQMFMESYSWDTGGEEVPYQITGNTGYGIAALSMAFAYHIGRLLGFSQMGMPYNMMLVGRLGNLLFYVLVFYFAIKRSPYFNKLMLLVGLMPMSLFLGATLNYDAILIPITVYFVALVLDLGIREDEQLTWGEVIRVLLCVVFLADLKQGLCTPLLILLLTIPIKKYGSTRKLIFCISLVLIAAIIGYIPNMINQRVGASIQALSETTPNSQLQLQWVLSNLKEIPGLFRRTFDTFFGGYVNMFWGVLGWLDVYIPTPVMFIGYLVLFTTAIFEGCSFAGWRGKRWKNILSIAGTVVSILGVFMSMYLFFTQVTGYYVIEGVQGRYFIPMFIPLILAFSNPLFLYFGKKTDGKAEKVFSLSTPIWGACCGTVTVFILASRYWM